MILNKIAEGELLSPILVLEILKKKNNMKFETVKNFIISTLSKEKKNLDIDKKEFEANYAKLEKFNSEVKELRQKAKVFNILKCAFCNQNLNTPAVYFLCNHAFHTLCLNAEIKDDMQEIKCIQCANSKIILFNIREQPDLTKD
jgi:hypothetical protein